ncbi:MAG: sigma-70 family RNA polymerase sigma factor [Chitinophagaceae bacterium]|nr:sigma-70 family RNA polymerase sigma factor [Chitinophagaceae bacterium]
MNKDSSQHVVDHLFRHESGKMIAVLTRIFGVHNLEMAEDVVQEAFLKATQVWKFELPENPSAWLMKVAKNKALDLIRRQQNFRQYSREVAHLLEMETESTIDQFFHEAEISDSQLRLVFTCCHPLLKEEDQVALTLKTISGFGSREIAKALLTNEETIQKRLYRAKQFIKEEKLDFEIPAGKDLNRRLEMVHAVLYLLFNEGYNSTKADELIQYDLCAEAMRLCKLLVEHPSVTSPSSPALLSLMCFHAARFNSRLDENNSIILLAQQDRTKWNEDLIKMGSHYLNLSTHGNIISIYHIESALAAEHSSTKNFEDTNWQRLLQLYDLLLKIKPSPMVELNRAVVLAEMGKIQTAIETILSIHKIDQLLGSQYIYSAVLGDFYKRLNDTENATEYLLEAFRLTSSEAEKKLITKKLQEVTKAIARDDHSPV